MTPRQIRSAFDALIWILTLTYVYFGIIAQDYSLEEKLSAVLAILLAAYWTIRALESGKGSVNDQKQLEEDSRELRFQRDRHMAFFALTHDGIIVLDKNNNILRINEAMTDISGYTAADAVGHYCPDIFRTEKYKETGIAFGLGFLTEENPTHYEEVQMLTKDGQHIDVGVRCTKAKKFPGHRGASLILIRDLTKIHEAESMEHEFVSMTSHQLFTPLSIIRGHLSMLMQGDLGKINEKQHYFLNQTLESTKKMVNLITELLSISRLEERKIVLNFSQTNITAVVQSAVEEMKTLAVERKIDIVFEKPSSSTPTLNMDGEKITQVVQNLIDNAIKYTNPRGKIVVKIETRPKDVVVSVSDNGVGIPSADIPKLFQRFFRSGNVLSMDTRGTGLGLYIAKVIITRHQGKIWVESKENQGSTFFFSLPR
ncbi:MAG: ATP-binding protein [Patescibacteria group bacterium]|jgi:PAS domain S-box-containing protein